MEGFLAWVAVWALSVPFLIGLLVIGLLAEHNESRGWAIFLILVASVVSANYFKLTAIEIATYAGIYGVIGVLWSGWRYKRHVAKEIDRARRAKGGAPFNEAERRFLQNDLNPSRMTGTLVAWILVWPFSVIDSSIGDLISAVTILVRTVFKGMYTRIYNSAMDRLM